MSWARNIIWTSKNEPAWVLACLLVASPGLLADDSGVEVRRSGVKALETPPGKVITTGFVVANRNAIGGEFVETVALPPGWLKVAPAEDRFPLAARAEELRLLAILVPPTAAAGVTEVRYSVRGGEGDASVSEGRFTVRVLAVARLELLVEDKPEAVIAGEDYEVKLRVLNHGNSTNRIRLVTLASPPIETLLDLPELVLAPASAQTVSVRVKTTARIDRKVTQILSFKAVGEDGAGASTTSPAQAAVVEVIPKVTGDTDTWNRLPVQMRVVAVKETGQKAGLQAEFSGAGNLDDTGKRQTEFLFRGPDLQQKSMYGQRDEYRLSYADPLLEVQLGDRSYTVSPLLERNGYGRGAELGLHTTNNSAEILYLENRPGQTPFSEFGGNLQHRVTPWLSLQGNYLNREGSGHAYWTNGVAQSLYGLEPKLRLGTAFDLDMELAASQGQARQGGSAVAARLECHGDLFDQLHYAVEKVYAAPGFYGYYNDVDSLQSSLTFPIYGKLRGNLAYTEYRNNLEQNPLKSTTATRETTYRPGLRYTFPFRAELQIDYQHIDRADVLRPVAYDFTEDSVRVGLGRTFGPVRLQTFIEQGQLEDRVLNRTTDDLHRYSFDASYYPSPRQTYSAYASFGNSSFTVTDRRNRVGPRVRRVAARGERPG